MTTDDPTAIHNAASEPADPDAAAIDPDAGDSTFSEPDIIDSELLSVESSDADTPPGPGEIAVADPGEVEYYESDLENLQGAVTEDDDS